MGQDIKQTIQDLHEAFDASVDPLGIIAPIVHAHFAWLTHPVELTQFMLQVMHDSCALQAHAWQRLCGVKTPKHVILPHQGDTRFVDPVWEDSPTWDILKESYLLFMRHIENAMYKTPGLASKERRRASFWWRQWLNAVAPSNYLWSNPVALRKAIETRGQSLLDGAKIFLEDLHHGGICMTDPDGFTVGKDLAMTPGAVVFRNHLVELIHYQPTQAKVHEIPIVLVSPWINKFYVLDLTPQKSMVKYLLDQGFDVFVTSWKNPSAEMRDVSFDDYLIHGVHAIVEFVREFRNVRHVHAVGYCIGGTLLAAYMAWLTRRYTAEDQPVAHWTLLASLVDFHKPGDIEVFLDEGSVRWISHKMEIQGYLEGKDMAMAFRLLRSNSLIWHYVVHGWLYGEKRPSFDVLFWNMDTTRMPYAMHAYYLREFYLNNKLIHKNGLVMGGEPIDLERISQPLYAVGAHDDHISPWRQTFRILNFVMAPKRYVLTSSGHILGIINPPAKVHKRTYQADDAHRADTGDIWRARATEYAGSWWEDWVTWLKPRCGPSIEAPPAFTDAYPKLSDAPGVYVFEK